ncbi:MAG: MFS transporter [Candidatus Moranbacteria bacterium]|nr:MFS transporter [Candidatus Moranbacteria bacterium]MBP6034155.1 MFS transporter [Candidatus Moranbacteria bacterium]MBP7695744.1 MFS transporter [Candidatus Moranbacteria bacterium]
MSKPIQHHEQYSPKKSSLVSLLSFALAFVDALILYTISSFIETTLGTQYIGAAYFIAFGIHLILLLNLQGTIRKIGKIRYLLLCLGLAAAAVGILPSISDGLKGVALAVAFLAFSNTAWVALDVILEGYSKDQLSGRIRGLHLTIVSIGFLLTPYLATRILDAHGYAAVFLIVFIGYATILLMATVLFRFDNHTEQPKIRLWSALQEVSGNTDLRSIFIVSLALEFFYTIMVIYMPIHLQHLGFAWTEIGIIFTIMLLPFVFLQYPIGLLADKRYGEKELLALCLLITTAAMVGVATYSEKHLLAWGAILFMTRVGIAGIEVLRDSYFYKQIDGDDIHIIAFFRMARPVASMAGAVIAVITLSFFQLPALFIAVIVGLFLALFQVFRLKDTESEYDIANKASVTPV